MGQNIQILDKKQGCFYPEVYDSFDFFSKSCLLKSIRIVLEYYLNPVSNIPSA